MKLPKKVVIDNKRWLRGEIDSMLLRPTDNKMCCVGFVCKAMGFEDDALSFTDTLSDLITEPDPFRMEYLDTGEDIYQVNDDTKIKDHRRRQKLKRRFAKLGIELSFIN